MSNRRRSAIIALLFVAAFFVSTRTGSTHEPITTKVMFNKEVIRILNRNCLACHAPGKIKADIPLTTYEEARPWAKAIKEEVLEKRMVPFQAVKGYGKFLHDYALPQRDVELLVSWIEGGAPRGEAKDYPKAEIERLLKGDAWPLGQPGLVLQPEKEAKIERDKTECFLLPTNLKEARQLNAIDFQPGNGAVVHSAEFFLAREVPPNVRMTACALAGESMGNWVPGQAATQLPQGLARRLPAGANVLLKVNYRGVSEAATDRSRLALYFAKDPAGSSIRSVAISPATTTIPAGAENYRVRASMTLTEASEAVAIRPLLFPFAKSIEATAYRPDGTVEVLIVTKGYRYDWQPSYQFRRPVALPKGTRVEVTAYLDNSDDNRNNPNDPPAALQFNAPLCEVALTQETQLKSATLRKGGRKGGVQ